MALILIPSDGSTRDLGLAERPTNGDGADAATARDETRAFARLRRISYLLFSLQLLGFGIWSAILFHRYALTIDFAGEDQAWYLMAHGHLNPIVNQWGDTYFLKNHGELFTLIMAPFYWIWPHGDTILWFQDLAAVACELVAFRWILEVVQRAPLSSTQSSGTPGHMGWRSAPSPLTLGIIGLSLLLLNPWTLWTVSFDFHIQTMATLFALLAAYDIAHARRRAWWWILLTLSCGDVAATFVFGVGLSAVLAGKEHRRVGYTLMMTALAFVGALTTLGANEGSGLSAYATPSTNASSTVVINGGTQTIVQILQSMVTRPQAYLAVLWSNALNIYANVLPVGAIGFGAAWGFGVPMVVLLSNDLRIDSSGFAFQNFPIYPFLTLGTMIVLAGLAVRRPRLTWGLGVLFIVNALVWSVVWLPRDDSQWLRVPATTARTLQSGTATIPTADEVVASQGISGPLAERTTFYSLPEENPVPVRSGHVWFVLTPEEGIETSPPAEELGQLAQLVGPLHGQLTSIGHGTFVVKVTPSPQLHSIDLNPHCPVTPAWALPSDAGRPDTAGPVATWGMQSAGRSGYLIKQDYERLRQGAYVAAIALDSSGPLTLEVWDADRSLLLARQEIPSTNDASTVELPFVAPAQMKRSGVAGVGLWQMSPEPAPPNDQIEVRVYTAGGTHAVVRSTQIVRATATGAPPRLAPAGEC